MTRRAFSLVELSIVLVILGLLVGGVLSGQALIRAAELRSISSDYARYTAAVNTFRDKYMALPGDMTNATAFWGIAGGSTGNDASCYSVASTGGMATCNGNGNGRIYHTDGVADGSAPEWFRAWQHLANAGLVEGTYSGVAAVAPRGAQPGKNVPQARISNVGFTLMSSDGVGMFPGWSGDYLGFTVGSSSGTVETYGSAFKPEEAWNIDIKNDDGIPNTGNIRDAMTSSLPCHITTDGISAYNLASSTIACGLFMAINPPGGGQ